MNKADALRDQVMTASKALNKEELDQFMTDINMLSLAILRGMHGDEFAHGFLMKALCDDHPLRLKPQCLN